MSKSTELKIADPIGMEVFCNRLLTITEDMNNTLIRSSFSTNIKERKDCSVALFDVLGRLVAQGTQIPLHLGSLNGAIESVLNDFPVADIRDGDVFICNDPYLSNGSHLPDINIVTPVFWDGELSFFTANIAHHSDVGGTVPGSIAGGSKSIFEEGIRIPACRIVAGHILNEDLLRIICNNTRDPEERRLDLNVQIGTNTRGAEALRALIGQMGMQAVKQSIDDFINYTQRRVMNRIEELKPGTYRYTSYMDDDGLGGGDPVVICVALTVEGGSLHFDFTGSSGQARGAMNLPMSAMKASVYYAVKAILDPDIAPNAGLFAPISIHAPVGTITNPRPPAAVGARSITAQKVAGAIFGAFQGLLPPEKIMAASNDCCPAIVFSGNWGTREGDFVYLETLGGGSGARFDKDGMDAVHVHMTNTSNLPIEALENEYPLLVDEYALIPDSGGAGLRRGGLGIAKQIRARADGITFSARSDNHVIGRALGVKSGGAGRQARLIQNFGTRQEQELFSKTANMPLEKNASVRIETSGGGGFGAPQSRPRGLVEQDVRNGKVSLECALRDFGYSSDIR